MVMRTVKNNHSSRIRTRETVNLQFVRIYILVTKPIEMKFPTVNQTKLFLPALFHVLKFAFLQQEKFVVNNIGKGIPFHIKSKPE